jgi:ATP-binding cassette, subfamily B, bacterial
VTGRHYRDRTLLRRILRETRPSWRYIALTFIIALTAVPLALLTPVALKIAVDSVIGSHPVPPLLDALLPSAATGSDSAVLVVAALFFVLIALLQQLQILAYMMLTTYTGQRLVLQFRSRLFAHAQRMSLAYHDSKGSMDTTYRVQYDAPCIRYVTVDVLIPLATSVLMLGAMIYITALIDWQLALVALAVSPFLFVAARAYRPRLRSQWHASKELESSSMSVVQEVLGAMRVVKAFGLEARERERYLDFSRAQLRAQMRATLTQGMFAFVVGITIALSTATVLFIGVQHVQSNALTLGELILVLAYLTQLYNPLRTISNKVGDLQSSFASAERVFSLFDEAPDLADRPDGHRVRRASGAVVFENVSFGYGENPLVLDDISFEVAAGSSLGIAGVTGAGKTTLVGLITRFYDPIGGKVLLDGRDLREYRLGDLRRQFAIVLQDPALFSMTIAENIACGKPDATLLDIEAAARAANAHEFIVGLPDGYNTQVGERGMRLSGGERQRIALARAFIKDAPALILDEPTSSVDIKTEASIMRAMERLMAGRTTFVVAHRLGTLDYCDERVEIANGRIVERAAA